MRAAGRITFLAAVLALLGAAEAGHEAPVYPSYYPQEIRILPIDPAAATSALAEGRIQAYLGAIPAPPASEPSVAFVESLHSYLVVRTNPDSPRAASAPARCALARSVIAAIAADQDGFRFHPYPVTPLHADYLHHFDLALQARTRVEAEPGVDPDSIRVRAAGPLAEQIVRSRWTASAGWDAAVEEVAIERLTGPARVAFNGWMGPPWIKEGWFHAELLLAGAGREPARAEAAATLFARLQQGAFQTGEERINLERALVTALTGDCRTMVAGYGVRQWHYGAAYSSGVENIAFDSQAGFRSAIFVRTVKLKEFPWNGWLALGVPAAPEAAWNPLGGFTDETGRLIWFALGDPALFPEPYNSGWTQNRIGEVAWPDR